MTQRASLVFLCLVVKRRDRGHCRINREGVALQAKQIDLASPQQARIRRAMRQMTGDATLCFHRRVLVSEGARLVGMAGKTNYVLGRR